MHHFKMATTNSVSLSSELNNLRKSELIEIIISQKVPERITNECVIKYIREMHTALEKYRDEDANASFRSFSSTDSVNETILQTQNIQEKVLNHGFISSQPTYQAGNTNTESRGKTETVVNDLLRELETMKNENDLLKKLEIEMRERIDLMVFKINVLENDIKGKNVNKGPHTFSASVLQPTAQGRAPPSQREKNPSTPATKHSVNNVATTSQIADGKTTTGSTIKDSFQKIIGTGPTQGGIIASTSNGNNFEFLYVNNLVKNTSEEMLKQFFKNSKQMDNIFVKKLKENDFSCSFKVGVPKENLNLVLESGFWSAGVRVQKFQNRVRKFFPTHNRNR